MRRLVIATNNLHKVREFREMLKPFPGIDVFSLSDYPQHRMPVVEATTFEESASAKAVNAARILQEWVLADEAGLVVPVLNGAPGIKGRTYAGSEATDPDNCHKVLFELEDKADVERAAYFKCCLVLASSLGVQKAVTGICEGEISMHARGRHGYGYDAIFRKHDYEKTFSELDEGVKNRISHRRKAFEKILLYLENCTEAEIQST